MQDKLTTLQGRNQLACELDECIYYLLYRGYYYYLNKDNSGTFTAVYNGVIQQNIRSIQDIVRGYWRLDSRKLR